MRNLKFLKAAVAGLAALRRSRLLRRPPTSVGLITKTETNPFFVKMREGATAKAKELGIDAERLRRQI